MLRSPGLLIAAGALVLNLIVAGLVGAFLLTYDATLRGQARTNAENLVRALEAGLEGTLSQIDIVLQSVADEYQRELAAGGVDAAKLQETLERLAARSPETAGMRIADAAGEVRYSSLRDVPPGVSDADREYFRALRDDASSGVVISNPEFGRIVKKWIVFEARRLSGPDGAFAGEVHVTLPVGKFEQMFSTLDIGSHGVVGLWNGNARLIARVPETETSNHAASGVLHPSPELAALIAAGRDSGCYHTYSSVDGVTRLFAMRKVGRFPLFLIVGLADVDYLAQWGAVAEPLAIVGLLFFIASVSGGLLVYSRAATKARAEAQARLAASVYEHSSEAMVIFDATRSIIDVNRSFTNLTGFSVAEARGRKIERWFSTLSHIGLVARAARALSASGHWSGEVWINRKGGKPFCASASVSAVSDGAKWVVLFADATEHKRTEDLIWRQANFDTVTQLPNRRHFCDAVHREIVNARTTKAQIAVIFIDLDRFKDVNDRFGHAVGDELLRQAAERIRACVRANDLVARLGGDEFTVMLPDVGDPANVDSMAERIVAALAQPYTIAGERTFTSASLGVTFYPRDGEDVDTLLRNADQAMYAAKRNGRNGLQLFVPKLHLVTANRASLVSDLHSALANNEIEVHYQPIVDIGSGRIVKAEALARWRHPKLGYVSPGEFIPIAEETGLIIEIGDWIFRRAAAQALRWRRAFDPQFQISVNVSAVQLAKRSDASAGLDRIVAQSGLGPGAIIVEITESVLVDTPERVRELIARYHKAGIEIALDDFGAGYSSLAYLTDFEVNYLKLDRAFVAHLAERPRDYAVCEAVVAMAHKLGMRVIAEGVESEAQSELLAAAGCEWAQGYLYSRPAPAADFEAMFFAEAMRAAS